MTKFCTHGSPQPHPEADRQDNGAAVGWEPLPHRQRLERGRGFMGSNGIRGLTSSSRALSPQIRTPFPPPPWKGDADLPPPLPPSNSGGVYRWADPLSSSLKRRTSSRSLLDPRRHCSAPPIPPLALKPFFLFHTAFALSLCSHDPPGAALGLWRAIHSPVTAGMLTGAEPMPGLLSSGPGDPNRDAMIPHTNISWFYFFW